MSQRSPTSPLILAALALALALAGCRGSVTARGMRALGKWSNRPIAVEAARPGESADAATAREAAIAALEEAGLPLSRDAVEGPLVVRVREVGAKEGRDTLLSSPKKFAAAVALEVVGQVGEAAAESERGAVRGAGQAAEAGVAIARGVESVAGSSRVRVSLELLAPGGAQPLGGVVWEGYENLSRAGAFEQAGREGGAALAQEIAGQRGRWVDRRPASERLLLTPTPLLLEPGEVIVSLEQGLLLHAGVGVTRWLQLDAVAGGWLVPSAGGIVHSRWDGTTLLGALGVGAKVRLLEEGPLRPGIAFSWDWVSLWSGGISSGRIALLDKSVDADAPDASSRVGFNLLTLAVSKHPTGWLQVGAGGILVDYNAIGGGGAPLLDEDGSRVADGFLALLPYANVEARAGEHFRLVGEFLYRGGVSIGLRTLLFGSRQFEDVAGIRTSGWRARLDTAAILTSRDTDHGSELSVLPWIGIAIYPR